MARRWPRMVAIVAVAATSLVGCDGGDGASVSAPKSHSAPGLALPTEGVVENADGKVLVRRLDGTVATELPSMRVDEASSPAQAPRLVSTSGKAFRLSRQQLRPDPSASGDAPFSGDGPQPPLPPPQVGAGHWTYVFPASGRPALGQWSGECEQSTAYLFMNGRPVGLGTAGTAVESVALGLTMSGAPVVLFPRTSCGAGSGRTGVYVGDRAGHWRQVTVAVTARYFRR